MWAWRIHLQDGKLAVTVAWGLSQADGPRIQLLSVTFHRFLGLSQTVVAGFQEQTPPGTVSKGCQFLKAV